MSSKYLVLLRPCKYGKYLRLGFFTEDAKNYVLNKAVKTLYVDLGNGKTEIKKKRTYVNRGSIVDREIISDWLNDKGFIEKERLLFFELEIGEIEQTHSYRFLGTVENVLELIHKGEKKLR